MATVASAATASATTSRFESLTRPTGLRRPRPPPPKRETGAPSRAAPHSRRADGDRLARRGARRGAGSVAPPHLGPGSRQEHPRSAPTTSAHRPASEPISAQTPTTTDHHPAARPRLHHGRTSRAHAPTARSRSEWPSLLQARTIFGERTWPISGKRRGGVRPMAVRMPSRWPSGCPSRWLPDPSPMISRWFPIPAASRPISATSSSRL